jgi:membrane-associated phospholipid phosphatase
MLLAGARVMGILGMVGDVPKAVLAIVVATVGLLAAWVALDRRGPAAVAIRRAFGRSPWPGRGLVLLLSVPLLVVVVDDVVRREPDQVVLQMDRWARETALTTGGQATVRRGAGLVSWLTGPGLVASVLLLTAGLALARRWRDAAVLVIGTASAWLLSGGLKLLFGVVRPRGHHSLYDISRFGFPSAHVLVTIVACGLLAWIFGRDVPRYVRRLLYVGACVVAIGSGLSRIVLDAHWLSDVVAGFTVGLMWLIFVTSVVARRGDPRAVAGGASPDGPE